MTAVAHQLASGAGWRVSDVICNSGPRDRPFEEQHASISIAAVLAGTFQYRVTRRPETLVPGAFLLGNHRQCFECGHEHGVGDRCLAFQFTPDYFESIVREIPKARIGFGLSRLPPLEKLMPLVTEAEAARDIADTAWEEFALTLAGEVVSTLAEATSSSRTASHSDVSRVTDAVRFIEQRSEEPIPLSTLARHAGMTPFYFLRVFRDVAGMTPHQYLLRTRLHRAAVALRRTDEAISAIAYDAGFSDLSTFNRRFRKLIGVNPRAYRSGRGR